MTKNRRQKTGVTVTMPVSSFGYVLRHRNRYGLHYRNRKTKERCTRVIPLFAFLLVLVYHPLSEASKTESYKDIPVKVIREVSLPKGYHEGLFYDGENMWVSNGEGGNTWIVATATGSVISEIEASGTFTEAITSAGEDGLWMTDWDDKKLHRIRIEAGKMINEYSVSLDPAHPAGVVYAGDDFYVVTWTRGLSGTKYHLLQMDKSGNVSRRLRIKGIHEPAHLAWDGASLWVTSWYSQRVYKIDVKSLDVLGSFRSPAPMSTGITWDGEYLWITGTYADLYKVEVQES